MTQMLEQGMTGHIPCSISHSSSQPQLLNVVLKKDWHVVEQGNNDISFIGDNDTYFVTSIKRIKNMKEYMTVRSASSNDD